jgi:arsenate reductase
VNYFIEPIGEAKLRDLLRKASLRPFDVLRKAEPLAKELALSADTPDAELIRAIVENPALLQRPIVEVGDRAVLARPADKALELIRSDQ